MAQHPTGKPPSGADPTLERRLPELDPSDVAAYLRRHPQFLVNRPDLAAVLAPPKRDLGDGVIDLQVFMIERLRADVARLKLTQRKLIATSRNNMASQKRVHAAVLAMLGATSFEQLISVITDELTYLLDVDAVGLCVEASPDGPPFPNGELGVHVLRVGMVDALIGAGRHVLLRAEVAGDPGLFGGQGAGLVRSDALVRLKVSSKAPIGLLALGARRPGVFHPGQGTELLTFLGQVIEHMIRAWLDLPE